MTPPLSPMKWIVAVLYLLLWTACVLILAGDLQWIAGWVFGAWL